MNLQLFGVPLAYHSKVIVMSRSLVVLTAVLTTLRTRLLDKPLNRSRRKSLRHVAAIWENLGTSLIQFGHWQPWIGFAVTLGIWLRS